MLGLLLLQTLLHGAQLERQVDLLVALLLHNPQGVGLATLLFSFTENNSEQTVWKLQSADLLQVVELLLQLLLFGFDVGER